MYVLALQLIIVAKVTLKAYPKKFTIFKSSGMYFLACRCRHNSEASISVIDNSGLKLI